MTTAFTSDGAGYVYVVQFDDLAIKVGRSSDPTGRIDRHRVESAKYGQVVTAFWSAPTSDAFSAERELCTYCTANGQLRPGTREYYTGLSFVQCVAVAENLAAKDWADHNTRHMQKIRNLNRMVDQLQNKVRELELKADIERGERENGNLHRVYEAIRADDTHRKDIELAAGVYQKTADKYLKLLVERGQVIKGEGRRKAFYRRASELDRKVPAPRNEMPASVEEPSAAEDVLAVMSSEARTVPEIMAATGLSRATVYRQLAVLADQEAIHASERGRWRLVS
jgi:DNA-binding transcriptional ArsR family regulator